MKLASTDQIDIEFRIRPLAVVRQDLYYTPERGKGALGTSIAERGRRERDCERSQVYGFEIYIYRERVKGKGKEGMRLEKDE